MLFRRAVSSTRSCSLILWLLRRLLELLFTVLGWGWEGLQSERGSPGDRDWARERDIYTWYLIQSVTLPDLIMSAWCPLVAVLLLLAVSCCCCRPSALPHSLSQSPTSRPGWGSSNYLHWVRGYCTQGSGLPWQGKENAPSTVSQKHEQPENLNPPI